MILLSVCEIVSHKLRWPCHNTFTQRRPQSLLKFIEVWGLFNMNSMSHYEFHVYRDRIVTSHKLSFSLFIIGRPHSWSVLSAEWGLFWSEPTMVIEFWLMSHWLRGASWNPWWGHDDALLSSCMTHWFEECYILINMYQWCLVTGSCSYLWLPPRPLIVGMQHKYVKCDIG